MEESNQTQENQGFENYPERRPQKTHPSWYERLAKDISGSDYNRKKCESNVCKELEKSPILKILLGALKSAGCPFNIKRHIVCEDCDSVVHGGFDYEMNQIVICKNVPAARDAPLMVLYHELIHMYDYCVNELDFKNLEHVACTEIRAANLAHCSFFSAWWEGHTSFFDLKKTHHYCVKMRAAYSLKIARNVDMKTAYKIVTKVFDKCYNDLEPIGRRLRPKSAEPKMAYEESKCFGVF